MAEKPFKSRFQRRKKQTLELKWDQMRARQRWDKKNKINNSPSPSVTRGFFVTHLCRAPIWSHFNSKVCFLRHWNRILKENKAYKGLVKAACRTASVTMRVTRSNFIPVENNWIKILFLFFYLIFVGLSFGPILILRSAFCGVGSGF